MRVVVEGDSDTGAATRVVQAAGHVLTGEPYVKRGKSNLDAALPKYARAAVREPWVVFRDSDNKCPVELRQQLMASIRDVPPMFSLRIAHTMTEAWFMADRDGCADYFGLSASKLPSEPEDVGHAKLALLQLCAKSRKRTIREGMLREGGLQGPLFVYHLNDFAINHWNIEAAAESSPSLSRAIAALRAMPEGNVA